MANPEHLKILKQGVEAWNMWRRTKPKIRPNLSEADLKNATLQGVNLHGANLYEAKFYGAKLVGANLRETDLRKANLRNSHLMGANLRRANLSHASLYDAILENTDFSYSDLSRANLNGARLTAHDPPPCNLSYANLTGASLGDALIWYADLSHAILRGVYLQGAVIRSTEIREADLTGANLQGAYIISTNLHGADLGSAFLGGTVFGDVNLTSVKALESCRHFGPSHLDYTTLARSGTLPLNFLRGCGLSDEFIDYLPSLFNQAIEYYSCFISYSTKDQEFADRLYSDLQNKGVRCWFAPHDIQGGKKIHEQIDEAIRMYEKLLLILSEASMNSEWVKTEIANARQKEVEENRRVLFPIALAEYSKILKWKCFDADRGKDSAREIREYFIPDFSNWENHDSYQKAFERLLRDLKSEKVEDKPK